MKRMSEARVMTLEEVEQCDYAYILYEKDDPKVHCFLRMHTYDDFISFDRPIIDREDGRIAGGVHSQPHLWKEYYCKSWFAFATKPDREQIYDTKRLMKE